MKQNPLAIARASAFVCALGTSFVLTSMPVVGRAFETRDASLLLSAYLLTVGALFGLAKRAIPVVGNKRLCLTGFLFFAAGAAMCAGATTFPVLIAARVVAGVGGAVLLAIGAERRIALLAGFAAGPLLGGMIVARFGYHSVFVVLAGAGATGAVLAMFGLPADEEREEGERPNVLSLDLPGALLFVLLAGAVPAGLAHVPEKAAMAIAVFGAMAFAMFLRHERIARRRIAEPDLSAIVTAMLLFALPFELDKLNLVVSGAYLTVAPLVLVVVAPLGAMIAERWGARLPSMLGMIAVGLAFVAISQPLSGMPLVLALGLVGIGSGLGGGRDSHVGMAFGVAIAAALAPYGFHTTLLVAATLAAPSALLAVAKPMVVSAR